MLLGALEAGGTKMVCAIGDEQGAIYEQISIPTTTPEETIPKIIDFFSKFELKAIGVGSFGPVDVNPASESYGYILDTPKLAWKQYDFLGELKKELNLPMGLDTDVNSSCLGEMTFGTAKGLDSVLYLTIGTGIGAGICVGGSLLHGMLHPEAGHILLALHPDDSYQGKCPYHGACFEGLASGPAIEERWGKKAYELTEQKDVWVLEAYYIAQALMTYILTISPRRIILGGGVMHQEHLFPMIREKVTTLLSGYINTKELKNMEEYIVPASLEDRQGIMGCLELARKAFEHSINV